MTKRVLCRGQWWDVVKIISPNPYDDFILLSTPIEGEFHEDGITVPMDMILINPHDEEFFPDIPEIREVYEAMESLYEDIDQLEDKYEDTFRESWLGMLPESEIEEEE